MAAPKSKSNLVKLIHTGMNRNRGITDEVGVGGGFVNNKPTNNLTYVAGPANQMLSSFDPAARPPMSRKW